MKASGRVSSLLQWNPFQRWDTAPAALEAGGEGGPCARPLDSALPAAVEEAGEQDPAMAPSGFTHWF